MYHNPLAVTVGCVVCNATFDMSYENVEKFYFTFHHNSTQGPGKDITMLVHEKVF